MAKHTGATDRIAPILIEAMKLVIKGGGLVKVDMAEIAKRAKCAPNLVSMMAAGVRAGLKAKE